MPAAALRKRRGVIIGGRFELDRFEAHATLERKGEIVRAHAAAAGLENTVVINTCAVTAEAVRERLSRPLKESTVRTVLRRLEDKGYTTHTVDGRTYVYHAAEPRGRVAAKAVQRIVDWFCNGSVEEVLVGMVDTAMLDQRQLRMLADQVAKAKAKGGKK